MHSALWLKLDALLAKTSRIARSLAHSPSCSVSKPRLGSTCTDGALLIATAGCTPSQGRHQLRQGTTRYRFDISAPAAPPAAGDDVTYVIIVRDRNTGQPIEDGEGRLFARASASPVTLTCRATVVDDATMAVALELIET